VNRPIISKEIESVIKNSQHKKMPVLDGFSEEVYDASKEELTPINHPHSLPK